jgi:hypothetical protein
MRQWSVTSFDPRLELPAGEELLAVLGDRSTAAGFFPALGHPLPQPSSAAAAARGFLFFFGGGPCFSRMQKQNTGFASSLARNVKRNFS